MDNRQLVSVMSEISRRRVDVNDLGLALRAVAILTLEGTSSISNWDMDRFRHFVDEARSCNLLESDIRGITEGQLTYLSL